MNERRERRKAHGEHVVCVNRSQELLDMICMLLADEGFEPTPLPVTPEAIDEIRRLAPDAVIVDLIANDVISWTLIEQIRSDPATNDVPCIIVSTDVHALDQVRRERDRYGGDRLIPKPFDVFELCDHLRELLSVTADEDH